MNHLQKMCLTFGLAALIFGIVHTYKTDTWPSKEMTNSMEEICPRVNTTDMCRDQCNVNLDEVKRFELTTDLTNLPNSKELKCYLHCFMSACLVFTPNSLRLNVVFMMEQIEKLPRYQQDILFGMGRGCIRRTMHLKDRVEIAYVLNVCSKENDNEAMIDRLLKTLHRC